MSFFGNIGNAIKKGVVDTGHFAGKVASNPWVQGATALIPGAGIPLAAALGAAGGALKPGGGLKSAVTGGATGALYGAAGQAVKGVASKALPMVLSHLPGGGGQAPAGGGSEADPYGDGRPTEFDPSGGGGLPIPDWVKSAGGMVKDAAGNLVKSAGGGGSAADLLLGSLAAANAAKLQGQSTDYATGALKTANESYNQRAPLRLAGVEGLLHPDAGNAQKLAGVKANMGVGNPFQKRPLPLAGVG